MNDVINVLIVILACCVGNVLVQKLTCSDVTGYQVYVTKGYERGGARMKVEMDMELVEFKKPVPVVAPDAVPLVDASDDHVISHLLEKDRLRVDRWRRDPLRSRFDGDLYDLTSGKRYNLGEWRPSIAFVHNGMLVHCNDVKGDCSDRSKIEVEPRRGVSVSTIKGRPCIFGGDMYSLPSECYEAGDWTIDDDLPHVQRVSPGSIVHHNVLYICGGDKFDNNHRPVWDNTCEKWDIETGISLPPAIHFPKFRYSFDLFVHNDKVYAVGFHNKGLMLVDVENTSNQHILEGPFYSNFYLFLKPCGTSPTTIEEVATTKNRAGSSQPPTDQTTARTTKRYNDDKIWHDKHIPREIEDQLREEFPGKVTIEGLKEFMKSRNLKDVPAEIFEQLDLHKADDRGDDGDGYTLEWPNGIIPYELEPGQTTLRLSTLKMAMGIFADQACITFKHATEQDKTYPNSYLLFAHNPIADRSDTSNRACWTDSIGMKKGKNIIYLSKVNKQIEDWCWSLKTITHELMHEIGFPHEHQRRDRDDYIFIDENVLVPKPEKGTGCHHNVIINAIDRNPKLRTVGAYDYSSIMHYHRGPSTFPCNSTGQYYFHAIKEPIEENNKFMGKTQFPTPTDLEKIQRRNCDRMFLIANHEDKMGWSDEPKLLEKGTTTTTTTTTRNCDGVPVSDDANACCGTAGYNSNIQMCCNGRVGYGDGCCGADAFNKNQSQCYTTVPWVSHHGMTSRAYQAMFDDYKEKGYRLVWINGYADGNDVRFAAIWEQRYGPDLVAHHAMSSQQYQTRFDDYMSQGYVLLQVSGYNVNGVDQYAGIWEKDGTYGPWRARHGLSSSEYQTEFDSSLAADYRLRSFSGYSVANSAKYAGIWEKKSGPYFVTHHGMTPQLFQAKLEEYMAQGYSPKILIGYNVANEVLFIALWEKSTLPVQYAVRYGMSSGEYQMEFDKWVTAGYRLETISGYVHYGKFWYAAIWSTKTKMCRGVRVSSAASSCCGTVGFNSNTDTCCDGALAGGVFTTCCGAGKGTNAGNCDTTTSSAKWCAGIQVSRFSNSCCGSIGFNANTDTCCAGVLNRGVFRACCGTQGTNSVFCP